MAITEGSFSGNSIGNHMLVTIVIKGWRSCPPHSMTDAQGNVYHELSRTRSERFWQFVKGRRTYVFWAEARPGTHTITASFSDNTARNQE